MGNFAFAKIKDPPTQNKPPPVSILVCAKNERANLIKNIPYLLDQDYPIFEIVIINDGSTDDSLEVMHAFAKAHNKVCVVDVLGNERFWGSKKYALTLGIKQASHKHLLFIDADCRPASRHWIKGISKHFSEKKQLILGYGAHEQIKGSLLNRMIRFETLLTAMQYLGYASNKNPYMGVGRNLAYTSRLFYDNGGFTKHIKVPSGDDDLFVNAAATSENTAIGIDPDSFTHSPSKKSWSSWIVQKRRHTSVAHCYRPKHKLQLGLFYVSQVLFFIFLIMTLAVGHFLLWTLIALVLRTSICHAVIFASAKRLRERDLAIWAPLLEMGLIPIQFYIFCLNLFSKPKSW